MQFLLLLAPSFSFPAGVLPTLGSANNEIQQDKPYQVFAVGVGVKKSPDQSSLRARHCRPKINIALKKARLQRDSWKVTNQ